MSKKIPYDLETDAGIERTFCHLETLDSDPRPYPVLGKLLHPRSEWLGDSEQELRKHREDGGRVVWLPMHFSNLDPFQEGAAINNEPALQDMAGKSAIFTKPDWYNKPIIGRVVRWLYDKPPAILLSRDKNKEKRDKVNARAIGAMIFRAIHKGDDPVMYPSRHRVAVEPIDLPEENRLATSPTTIIAALQEQGIPVKLLMTGRYPGHNKLVRATIGVLSQKMVHSLVDPPEDLSKTNEVIRKELLHNTIVARNQFWPRPHLPRRRRPHIIAPDPNSEFPAF